MTSFLIGVAVGHLLTWLILLIMTIIKIIKITSEESRKEKL